MHCCETFFCVANALLYDTDVMRECLPTYICMQFLYLCLHVLWCSAYIVLNDIDSLSQHCNGACVVGCSMRPGKELPTTMRMTVYNFANNCKQCLSPVMLLL
jgi:hypothetical protein